MIFSLKVCQKSKVCLEFMYMKHKHRICGKLHVFHDLVLYKKVNDNAYSTPLRHEALDVDHKMVMLVIGLYHNTFSLICVQHQHYPEHETICLSFFLTVSFSISSLINDFMFPILLRQIFLELFSQTDIIFLCARVH